MAVQQDIVPARVFFGIVPDLLAGLFVVQAGVDVFACAVPQFDGNKRRETGGESRVGIAVERDIDAFGIGVVNLFQHPVDLVEIGRVLGFEVGDLQAGTGLAGGFDG